MFFFVIRTIVYYLNFYVSQVNSSIIIRRNSWKPRALTPSNSLLFSFNNDMTKISTWSDQSRMEDVYRMMVCSLFHEVLDLKEPQYLNERLLQYKGRQRTGPSWVATLPRSKT